MVQHALFVLASLQTLRNFFIVGVSRLGFAKMLPQCGRVEVFHVAVSVTLELSSVAETFIALWTANASLILHLSGNLATLCLGTIILIYICNWSKAFGRFFNHSEWNVCQVK